MVGCGDDGGAGESTDTSTSGTDTTMTSPATTASGTAPTTTTATTATTASTGMTATTQGTSTAGDSTSTTATSSGSSESSTTSFQCISEDEAIDAAVMSHYPEIADPDESHIVPPVVDNGPDGYTIQVCDLNIECPCRPEEGWIVDVNCEGVIVSDVLLGQCPFG